MKKIFTLIAAAVFTLTASAQQIWDFSVLPTQTIDGTGNLATNIDGATVVDYTSAWCQIYQKAGIKDEDQFTAKEGEIFEMTKGLKWGIMEADKMVAWYNATEAYGGCYLKANKAVDVTIPAKAGQIIEFIAATSKNTKKITSAGIDATVEIAQWGSDYAYTSYTCTVTEDNPTLSLENNICFQKIIVKPLLQPGTNWTVYANGTIEGSTNPANAAIVAAPSLGEGLAIKTDAPAWTWSDVTFLQLQPTADIKGDNKYASATEMNKYIDFKFTPSYNFKASKVGFDMIKRGTGDPQIFVDIIDGAGETTHINDNAAIDIRRNNDSDDTSISQSFETTATAAAGKEFTLRIYVGKLANNKQVGIANIFIAGEFEGASGVSAVKATNVQDGAIYNLAGQKVGRDYKGIVIINGKKFVNK